MNTSPLSKGKMATSAEGEPLARTQILDFIECTICLDIYTDPVALPCQHTFCRQCVDSILLRTGQPNAIPCPICRKEFVVPKAGLDGLEKDFKMNKLIGIYQSESSEGYSRCPTHRTKPMDVYCIDCRAVTCASCFLAKHSGHRGSSVSDSSDEVRKQLDQEIDVLSRCVAKALVKQTLLRNEMFQFIDEIKSAELEINKTSDYLKQTIEKHRQLLIDDLSRRKQRVQLEMEEKEKELDECVEITEKFKTRCCEMMLKATTAVNDICWSMKDTHSRAGDLQQSFESQAHAPGFGKKMKFKPTLLEKDLANCNVIGIIQDDDQRTESIPTSLNATPAKQPGLNPKGFTSESAEITTLDVSENIWSIAVLNDLICALCRSPTSIRFYQNGPPFMAQDEMKPTSIANPWDMKSCDVSQCLYITDKDNGCVWKVTPNERTVRKWLVGLSDPYRISVNAGGRVMIAKWGCPGSVEILQSNGQLLDRMRLPGQILEPRDAVEKPEGNVIVSHRWRDSGLWGITEMTTKGQIVHRFDPRDDSWKLNFPSELSIDSIGRIFVADYNNDRVIELGAELNCVNVLLTKDKDNVQKPRSLCHIENQLVVAHSGKISVLRIKET